MSDMSDGSLIINTELDNTGFQRGSDKLLDAIKDLTGSVDNLGDNMMQSFQQVIPLMQQVAGVMSEISKTAKDATQNTQQVEQSATGAVVGIGRTVTQNVGSLERETISLSSKFAGLQASVEAGFSSAGQVARFSKSVEELAVKLEFAKQKVEEFGSTEFRNDAYIKAETQLESLEAKLHEAYNLQDELIVKKNAAISEGTYFGPFKAEIDKPIAELEKEIEKLEEARHILDTKIQQFEASGAKFSWKGSDTDEYSRMVQNLERAQTLMDGLREKTGVSIPTPTSDRVNAWEAFSDAISKAGYSSITLTSNLAKISFKAVSYAVDSAKSKLKSFSSQAKQAEQISNKLTSTLTSFKRLLITRIKRMFISKIFSTVRNDLQELAKYSNTFNQSMSNLKNSASGLAANLSVSLGGLINTLEPVLTKIINLVSTAITYLNSLFALLGGKNSIIVAKKQTGSYAAGLDKAANSAGKAADAQEELNEAIYGFDELNKRDDSDSNSSTT